MHSHEFARPHRTLVTLAALFAVMTCALPSRAADTLSTNSLPPTLPKAERSPETDERLRQALQYFPEADANHDGVLTAEEARAFRKKMTAGQKKGGTNNPAAANLPTFADVKYGPYDRNVLDFWKAKSDKPAPVIVFIHGGGFEAGDKSQARNDSMPKMFLKAGISFAAINYRFRDRAPIQDILHDAARAIQFIRYQAADWNVDKKRIMAYGGSAGAGTSLWLAAHDDLADPKNSDPVLRESSRLVAAGLFATQATYDLARWESFLGPFKEEWLRSPNEMAEFYHLKSRADLKSPEGERIRAECDMLGWLSHDDPPIFAFTAGQDGPSQNRGHHLHHPGHVREIQKRCKEVGVECVVILAADNASAGAWRDEFMKFAKQKLGVSKSE